MFIEKILKVSSLAVLMLVLAVPAFADSFSYVKKTATSGTADIFLTPAEAQVLEQNLLIAANSTVTAGDVRISCGQTAAGGCAIHLKSAALTNSQANWRTRPDINDVADSAIADMGKEASVTLFYLIKAAPTSRDDGEILHKEVAINLANGGELRLVADLYLDRASAQVEATATFSSDVIYSQHPGPVAE